MTDTATEVLAHIPEGEVIQTELTLDEFLKHNPEEPPYLEYEGKGRVRRKMSPNTEHAAIAAELSHRFLAYRDEHQRRLYVYVELRTNAGGLSRLPDVAVYVDRRPRENQRKQALVVADLSIEILSPHQSRDELVGKCWWYIDQGSRFAMLIDPPERSLMLWDRQQRTIIGETETTQWGRMHWGTTTSAWPATYGSDTDTVIGELDELLPGLQLTPRVMFSVLRD